MAAFGGARGIAAKAPEKGVFYLFDGGVSHRGTRLLSWWRISLIAYRMGPYKGRGLRKRSLPKMGL